jgi:hypothetical protein
MKAIAVLIAATAAITAVATAGVARASDWAGSWGSSGPGNIEPLFMTVNSTDPFSAQVHMMWGQAGSCFATWTETKRVSATERIVIGRPVDYGCYDGNHWDVTIEPGRISGTNLDLPEMGFEVTPP